MVTRLAPMPVLRQHLNNSVIREQVWAVNFGISSSNVISILPSCNLAPGELNFNNMFLCGRGKPVANLDWFPMLYDDSYDGGCHMWVYTDKVQELFNNPKNVGEVDDADGVGEVGSLACGDALKLTFKLDGKGQITEARFQTFGCASAIASSSALTEMIIGKSLEEAEKITNQDIVEYLGGLPDKKMHCSVMGQEALRAAIADYRGQKLPKEDSEIVCECFGVTESEIEDAVIDNKLTTLEQVTDYTKAGGGCGTCHERIESIIQQVLGQPGEERKPEKPAEPRLSNIQKMKLIEETLEREIQPTLAKDGGSIELVDIIGDRVLVSLRGACATCVASDITLKHYVESKLRELVADTLVVEEVAQ